MEHTTVYKVKTSAGYFFTTSNGRYGRFGSYQDGFRYCARCANEIVEIFDHIDVDSDDDNALMEAQLEQVPQSWPCQNPKHKEQTL
jgi:hypothetical protein